MVVEADPVDLEGLETEFLQTRYIVLEAETEREAMRHVQGSDPHLVMLNFHLPRTNVRRLCEKPLPVSIVEKRVKALLGQRAAASSFPPAEAAS